MCELNILWKFVFKYLFIHKMEEKCVQTSLYKLKNTSGLSGSIRPRGRRRGCTNFWTDLLLIFSHYYCTNTIIDNFNSYNNNNNGKYLKTPKTAHWYKMSWGCTNICTKRQEDLIKARWSKTHTHTRYVIMSDNRSLCTLNSTFNTLYDQWGNIKSISTLSVWSAQQLYLFYF